MNRQQFHALLDTFVNNAIEYKDQRYGRQLASIMERYALHLRAEFGGATAPRSKTETTQEMAARIARNTVEAMPSMRCPQCQRVWVKDILGDVQCPKCHIDMEEYVNS